MVRDLFGLKRKVNKSLHYQHTFSASNQSAQVVLADLAKLCKINDATWAVDSNNQTDLYATGMIAGQQAVFRYIQQQLNLSQERLIRLAEKGKDQNFDEDFI